MRLMILAIAVALIAAGANIMHPRTAQVAEATDMPSLEQLHATADVDKLPTITLRIDQSNFRRKPWLHPPKAGPLPKCIRL